MVFVLISGSELLKPLEFLSDKNHECEMGVFRYFWNKPLLTTPEFINELNVWTALR